MYLADSCTQESILNSICTQLTYVLRRVYWIVYVVGWLMFFFYVIVKNQEFSQNFFFFKFRLNYSKFKFARHFYIWFKYVSKRRKTWNIYKRCRLRKSPIICWVEFIFKSTIERASWKNSSQWKKSKIIRLIKLNGRDRVYRIFNFDRDRVFKNYIIFLFVQTNDEA